MPKLTRLPFDSPFVPKRIIEALIMNTEKKDELELLTKPGDTILETLKYYDLTPIWFAEKMGMSLKTAEGLFTGSMVITAEIAFKLEEVLKIDNSFWLNADRRYRERLKEINSKPSVTAAIKKAINQNSARYKALRVYRLKYSENLAGEGTIWIEVKAKRIKKRRKTK